MSKTTPTPPAQSGQIESPNPFELFWEQNKKLVNILIFGIVLAIVGNYAWKEMQLRKVNQLWGGLASSTGLDKGYAEDGSMMSFVQDNAQYMGFYRSMTISELVSSLSSQMSGLEQSALEAELTRVKGTAAEPLVVWAMAVRAAGNEDWDAAKKHAKALKDGFPKHFLCSTSDYPVQWREEIVKKDKKEDEDKKPKKDEKPEYKPAVSGSMVDLFVAHISREQAFRAANKRFYENVAPDSKETVTFTFKMDGGLEGSIKVQLYTSKAPLHVAALLKMAKEDGGWWKGMRIHQVIRQAGNVPGPAREGEIHFGLPKSKDDDRTTWLPEDPAEEHVIDWETNDLSHFPGMLVVEAGKDGKSQVERLVITTADVASGHDGARVIIGRVVEGLEFAQQIAEQELASENEETQGRGKLLDNITVSEVVVGGT